LLTQGKGSQQINDGFCDIVSRKVVDVQAFFCELVYTVLFIDKYAGALLIFTQISYFSKKVAPCCQVISLIRVNMMR
jgi:hypothetical protein